jgi:hypothetical protein
MKKEKSMTDILKRIFIVIGAIVWLPVTIIYLAWKGLNKY